MVDREGPISLNLAARRVVAHWGIGKVGKKVRERVVRIASRIGIPQTRSEKRVFLWPPNIDPALYRIFRVPGDHSETRRGPEDLPPEEIANAALYVLNGYGSMLRSDLVIQTARILGFARTGSAVEHYIELGIQMLFQRGDALDRNRMINRTERPGQMTM